MGGGMYVVSPGTGITQDAWTTQNCAQVPSRPSPYHGSSLHRLSLPEQQSAHESRKHGLDPHMATYVPGASAGWDAHSGWGGARDMPHAAKAVAERDQEDMWAELG